MQHREYKRSWTSELEKYMEIDFQNKAPQGSWPADFLETIITPTGQMEEDRWLILCTKTSTHDRPNNA
ncbi:hypothetical protein EYC80_001174 [Monilinia laxa]|uniref:Uncharacterized protein n=1 Tax=Monilinia laxa TaxID=61186 RepID=A0A5N6K8F3_MONLA|nr:hypothetical protein EYC80_001174 [Monilinia laxa]